MVEPDNYQKAREEVIVLSISSANSAQWTLDEISAKLIQRLDSRVPHSDTGLSLPVNQ